MVIDTNPIVLENAFQVLNNINQDDEVSISVNGLMAIHTEDIISISNNIINITPGLPIDWDLDSFTIFYSSL